MKEVRIIMNFERVNGYPFVKSKMGDKPIGMLLDTGSRECILDASFYKECGGKPEMILPAEPLCSPSGNLETTGKTLINLTIGSNVLRVPVVLADISRYLSVIADELDFPIVGLLGTKFFHRWKFHIDFDNEMIYSYEPVVKENKTKDEIIESFQGKENVRHIVSDNGSESWSTQRRSFGDEAYAKGACKLNTVEDEHKNKHLLFLFNSKDEEVGRYYLGKPLQGRSPSELVEIKANLEFFDSWNPESKSWVPCVGLSNKNNHLAKVYSCKEGCGLTTILKDGHYYVVDKDNNYIVQPGKYDYIDGFDKCGIARVKIDGKVDIFNPQKTTYDRWGLIDTKGEEILPLEYSEIWSFYNKDRTFTSVFCDGFDEDDNYIKRMEEYHFTLPCKDYPKGKMRGPGEWFGNHFQTYEGIDSSNVDYNYSVWDALDGEPEAAGNIDYEW